MAQRGRPRVEATDEQRKNVEAMASIGIAHDKICLVVRDRSGKPIGQQTLERYFRQELNEGGKN